MGKVLLISCMISLPGITQQARPVIQVIIDPVFVRYGIQVSSGVQPSSLIVMNHSAASICKAVVVYRGLNLSKPKVAQTVTTAFEVPYPDHFVLTPDNSLTRNLNAADGVPITSQSVDTRLDSLGSTVDPGGSRPTVSLDLIVFSDGGALGPNKGGVFEFEKAKLESERDFLKRLEDTSLKDDELVRLLREAASTPIRVGPSGRPDLLQGYRSGFARAVVEAVAEQGRSGAAKWLRGALANRRPSAGTLHWLE